MWSSEPQQTAIYGGLGVPTPHFWKLHITTHAAPVSLASPKPANTASTCHCRQTSILAPPLALALAAPAAASPANAVFPPTTAADNGHRSDKSPLENCLPAARDRDESLPPLLVRGGLSPTPQTIRPSDTPPPSWSEIPGRSLASSAFAPSAPGIPSWRRSPGACPHSKGCARPRLHARRTPLAVAHSGSR